jgi:hypothetical protein
LTAITLAFLSRRASPRDRRGGVSARS